MKRKLPIGTSDFKSLIQNDYYFVDKSLIIKDILTDSSQVTLLPRPRRFGKTLNMSMLRYFFDRENAHQNRKLFDGLDITKYAAFDEEQGKYPVVFISFKDIKSSSFELAIEKIRDLIGTEFLKFKFLLQSNEIDEIEKEQINHLLHCSANQAQLENALKKLCKNLNDHFKQKPILLIDEYDTPIHSAFSNNYYDEMISFMGSFLGSALKDNEYLHKSVLTGTLRISRESIFTGLNNISIHTLLSTKFNDKFGFTQNEVSEILEDFGLSCEVEEVRKWYNGYIIGGLDVYNPWSIINFVNNYEDGFKAYWLNSSGNELIRDIIKNSPYSVQLEIKDLLDGKPLVKPINENIAFPEMKSTENSIYSFLFFSGYLKAKLKDQTLDEDLYSLAIPNIEVKRLYKEIIINWFQETLEKNKIDLLLKALTDGNVTLFERIFSDFVVSRLSFHLTEKRNVEKVYQAFTLGLLVSLADAYEVTAERESGYGRYDIALVPYDKARKAIIMEFKTIDDFYNETKDAALELALKQIDERKYETAISQRGYTDILKLAVVFDGKRVWVKN